MTAALLSARNLSMRFGGLQALSDACIEAHGGQITAMIGPNGAGKTTAINCISGVYRPQAGSVLFLGTQVLGRPAHTLIRLGLTRTFQNLQVFKNMNVLENVMAGMHGATGKEFLSAMFRLPGIRSEERRVRERAWEMLSFFGLEEHAYKRAGDLPYGDRKRVELARALVSRPKMVLLDEPVAGLNMAETDAMGELIVGIRNQGIGIVLVEHDMSLVMRISDHVVVLVGGFVLAEGTPHEIQSHPEVIRTYLGGGQECGANA